MIPLAALTLSACVSMDAQQCRSANWYDLGWRDGIFGMQPQSNVYESQCKSGNVAIDGARYQEGWQHGYWEFQARRGASGMD